MQTAKGIFKGLHHPNDDCSVKIPTICSGRKDDLEDDDVDEEEISGAKLMQDDGGDNPRA